MKGILLFVLILFLGAGSLCGQYCDSLELLANCFEGSYNHVTHKDTLTYIATANSIIAYNTKNPDSPVRISRTFLESDINLIYAYGNYLFVSGYNMGTRIYDVRNPKDMVLISTVSRPSDDIHATSGYLYVARTGSIYIYKISDINNPVFIKAITVYLNFYGVKIDVYGTRLYACVKYSEDWGWEEYYDGRMVVYSIADFENPVESYSKRVTYPYDISFNKGDIYLATKDGIDIYADNSSSTPSSIAFSAGKIKSTGNALLASNGSELRVYDITDKENVFLAKKISGFSIDEFSVDSNRLFTAGGNNFKFYTYYLESMDLRFSLFSEYSFKKIYAYDDRVFLGQLPYRIIVNNIDESFQPTKITDMTASNYYYYLNFSLQGKYLYLLMLYSFQNDIYDEYVLYLVIYDATFATPMHVKTLRVDNSYLDEIITAGGSVFIPDYRSDKTIFYSCSESNFMSLAEADTFSMNYIVTDISSDEDILFFATDGGEIVTRNITTYESDSLEKEHQIFTTKYISKISSDMPYVAALANDGWLYMLEFIRSSVSIEKKDSVFVGTNAISLEFLNHNVYLCCGEEGFKLYGFDNDSIELLDTFMTNYSAYSSAIDKARLYVGDPGTGLWVFRVDYEPDEIVLPFAADTRVQFDLLMLSRNLQKMKLRNFDRGEYTMEIKDLCGNTLRKEKFSVEAEMFEKEIETENLASGVYFLVVSDDDVFISKKMLRF